MLTVVGLIGFTLSGIYGVAQQNSVEHLKNGYVEQSENINWRTTCYFLTVYTLSGSRKLTENH